MAARARLHVERAARIAMLKSALARFIFSSYKKRARRLKCKLFFQLCNFARLFDGKK